MNFQLFGKDKAPTLLLIPGLGVSYEIFEGMNHGQLLIDHPEEIVQRIIQITTAEFIYLLSGDERLAYQKTINRI